LAGGGNNNTVNLDAGNFGQITTQAGTRGFSSSGSSTRSDVIERS
jgi:hypothetical protein